MRQAYEIKRFSELVSRILAVYDSVKHYNPPKEKIVTAVINDFRGHGLICDRRSGVSLSAETQKSRMNDYMAGLTDNELMKRWGIKKSSVVYWRHRHGLKPNKRGCLNDGRRMDQNI